MADVKISALSAVTAPSSSDVIPIVNSGATKKVALSNLPAAILSSSAFFWDNTNGRVGLGTTSPVNQLTLTGDLGIQSAYAVNAHKIYASPAQARTIRFDCASSDGDGGWEFYNSSSSKSLMYIKQYGSVVIGNAALATTATDGFLYIPTCAGAPTGTPTAFTGRVALIYDTSNNNFYIYNGAWKKVTLT